MILRVTSNEGAYNSIGEGMAVQNNYNNVIRDGLKVSLTGSASGDIFYRSGSGVFTRLGVGAPGQTLKVSDSNLPEWSASLTSEDIQDAVGTLFTNSSNISLVYDDAANTVTATVLDASISNAKLRDSGAATLIGRSASTSGAPSDISFTADGQVLMRSGGTLNPIDLHNTVIAYRLDEFAVPTSAVSLSGQKLTDLASPTANTDAANKAYVDNVLQGVPYKSYVLTASATNVDLAAPGASVGGVSLTSGQYFLLYGQTDATENGVYQYTGAASPAVRRADLELVPGMTIFVDEGTNADTTYQLTTNGPITAGVSELTFTIFGRVESITVASPLQRIGNEISVVPSAIDNSYLGNFPAATILGNDSGSAATAQYLTAAEVRALLGLSMAVSEEYIPTSATSVTMSANKAYRSGAATLATFTLPASCEEGATISIEGSGAGGWAIAQSAGQSIIYGDKVTASGVAGGLASIYAKDVIKLRCVVADTTFQVINAIGNIDVIE